MRLKLNHGTLQEILSGNRTRLTHLYIGFIIRRLREISGISQCDLARHAEANLSYVNSVEGGFNNISIRKIRLLCNALALSPAVMVTILSNIERSAALKARYVRRS